MGKINGHVFSFLCMAPDVNCARGVPFIFSFDPQKSFHRMLTGLGVEVEPENFRFYGPEWNSTVYSSTHPSHEGEYEDLRNKIITVLRSEGFDYNGETIETVEFVPTSQFAQCGYFLTFVKIEEE